jgi:hypothetical protein
LVSLELDLIFENSALLDPIGSPVNGSASTRNSAHFSAEWEHTKSVPQACPRAKNGLAVALAGSDKTLILLAYHGAQGRNRTTDTVIFSHVLYQLSYLGAGSAQAGPISKARAL